MCQRMRQLQPEAGLGQYRLGELDVELTSDDRVVLAGTRRKLAGSSLRMNRAVANLVRIGGVEPARRDPNPQQANPSRLIHLEGRTQGLKTGERGDIVVFRQTSEVVIEAVYLDGEAVYLDGIRVG